MSERLNLMSPEVHADPYPFYAGLRQSAPVSQVDPGGIWAVSRYADIVTVLKDPKTFSSAAWTQRVSPPWLKRNPLAESMFVLDPPAHTRMRQLINPALSHDSVDSLEPRMRAVAEELGAPLRRRREVEFIAEFAMPMAASAVGTVLGLPPALYPRFKHWTASIFSISANQHSPEQIAKIQSDLAEMEHYFGEHFAALRKAPSNGLVSQLLEATIDGKPLTEEQLMSFLFILLPGGLETTSTVLGDTMIMLAKYPEVLRRVRNDHSLIPKLVTEVMRYESTAHTVFRRTTRAVEIAGATVPEGAMVVCLLGSANRDEREFANADRFDIDRENNHHHVSFGYGVHHCVGVYLGRMSTRVALETLLPDIEEVAIGADGFRRHHALNARGPITLPLLKTRTPAPVEASIAK
jgi:cytochrome P450